MRKQSFYLLLLASFFFIQQIALSASVIPNYRKPAGLKPQAKVSAPVIKPLSHVPGNPILNDGFEDSPTALLNWNVVDQPGSSGSWFVQTGTASPLFGFPVPSPTEGLQAAMSDQGGPGSHILYQDFVVSPKGGTLSFDLYVQNFAGVWSLPAPETLDYTFFPNQHVRVDIMDPFAPVDDVGAGVLANLFLTNPADPLTFGYRRITASLDAFAGQTIRLRFVEVDNEGNMNMGIDNVSILSTALGLVADNATNSVIVFNADNDAVIGVVPIPLNGGVIGDVSISNDGTLGFVTNFGFQVYVIDLTATPPVLAGGTNPITISNAGEDIANSPDGQFLVVCDGGGGTPVSVIDIASRTESSAFGAACNGVDVCADGSVLIVDFFGSLVRRLAIDSGGNLTDTGESLAEPSPNNPSCVPGSATGLEVDLFTSSVNSFAIPGLGGLSSGALSGNGQTVITNPAGDRVFALSCGGTTAVDVFTYNPTSGALAPWVSIPVTSDNECFFGIDYMAIHPNGNKLYVSQPGTLNVYDPSTGAPLASITNPAISDPTGVAIRRVPNRPPVAFDDTWTMPEDSGTASIPVLGNDLDQDFDPLTITAVSDPPNGTAVINGSNIDYTPDPNFNGPDSFTYTITDGNGGFSTATVDVVVTEVNDPPIANLDFKSTLINTAVTFPATDLLANDVPGPANESGQTLTVISVEAVSALGGTVSYIAGNITYTPPLNYHGPDSFGYTIQDDGTTNGNPDPLQANGVVTVSVNCPITVSPATLPNGSVGGTYSQTLSASGGTGPYTFTVTLGALPAGLSLDPASGLLSGTPASPGISTFVVTATDALGCIGTQLYTVVIDCRTPGTLYGAVHGPGSFSPSTLVTIDRSTGATTAVGPIGFNSVSGIAFDASGKLYGAGVRASDGTPVILTIDPLTGAGTEVGPTGVPRISDLSFRSDGVLYAYVEPADELGTVNLSTGAVTILGPTFDGCCGNGMAFSAGNVLYHAETLFPGGGAFLDTLDQTTGAGSFVVNLTFGPPLGFFPRINAMKFEPASGVLFGSAQDGGGGGGAYFLTTIDITTGVVTIIGPTPQGLDAIAFAPQGIQLSPKTLPGGNVTVPYGPQTITASNGTAPYTFSLTSGALPPGVALNPSTGVISGTPTAAGPFAFVITATDATGCTGSQLYVIDINAAPCPVITLSPASLPAGTLGFAYSQTVSAAGGAAPYTFAVTTGALPAGLSLNPATGEISGTPSALGTTAFVITATDANGCIGSQLYTITIECPAITLAPPTLSNGSVGTPYSDTVSASGGTAPYTFTISAGALPPGLSLDPLTGGLTGTPTAEGTYSFVVTATDENGCTGSLFYSIRITCGGISVSPSGLPNGSVGAAYSQIISVTGGTEPFTFTVSEGSLPPGLSLDSETGLLSGTPTAPGVYTFEVTVTDANGCTGSQIYTVIIDCRTPGVLFGAVHGLGNAAPSDLVTIDRATGATTTIGPIGFNNVSGLTFSAAGTLYGAGLRPTDGASVILTIDPLTGAGTEIGPTGMPRISDLSFRSDGVLYAYIEPFDALGTVNLSTGAVTFLGPTGVGCCGNGMAFSAGDVLYHANDNELDTLDQTTANASFVAPLGFTPPLDNFPRINAMKFDPASGVLYGSAQDGGGVFGFLEDYLTTIDTTTGVVTIIGPTGLGLDAIAFAPTGIQVSPKTLPGGNLTIPYSQTITASNGTAPYTFSLTFGALPPGLGLNPSTGVISGTPTAAGPYAFVITATDAAGCTGSQLYVIDINPAPCPVITLDPATLAGGTLGFAYSQTISAIGGVAPFTFAVTTGALPAGLSLNPSTGEISGTPSALGTTAFVITATDANGCIGSQMYTITIECPVITLAPPTLPNGTVGTAYSATVTASGGAGQGYTFTISAGSLPAGLSLNAATGEISGTPTTEGTYSFVVTATDENGCSGSLFYTIRIGCPAITVTPSSLANGVLGVAYSQTVSASGGTEPYTFSITAGALPPGLSLDPSTGEIAGTPTSTGVYTVEVTATDANGCTGRQTYTVAVNCAGITVSPETLPDGVTGTAYSQTVSASGGTGPYSFSVSAGSMPPGLSLNGSTGEISGLPAAQGTFSFVITATDANDCVASRFYTIRINCPVITVSPSSLPNGTTTVPYSQTITASGGAGPYSFTVSSGSLPPGLSLNATTGVLDGTPTATGVFAFEVTATDSNDCTGTQLYAITVNLPACPTISLSPASLPGGTIGVAYSQTIVASGSSALPYAYSISSGVLPPGLTLNAVTGVISGTPTTGGAFAFVITAMDTNDCVGSQLYTVEIECPVITIDPTSLPNGVTGVPYSQTITASGSPATITFSVTAGTLPPGLTLNPATGVLSGTPTNSGTFSFTITATDANGCSASLTYTMSISCQAIDLSPSTLPNGVVGVIYGQTITASGGTGPYTFAVSSGALPPGLSLTTAGLLSGTPTLPGIYAFLVTATDVNGCTGTRLYVLAVGCATISVPPSLFPDAIVGTPYSQTIVATGGTAPYNYSVTSGALPAGLSLNAATGEISGIPSAAGTYSFTITATDANGCTGSWSYTINAICPAITLLSPLPDSIVGAVYNSPATASGGTAPYSYAVTAGLLPPGLTLDPSTGVVSGTPTTIGDFTFDITATDFYNCSGSQTYTVHISPACLFCDDFEDGVLAPNWTYIKPSWSESGGVLTGTPLTRKAIAVATPVWAGCSICSVETTMQTAGGLNNRVWFLGWYQDKKNTVELLMKQGSNAWILRQRVNGKIVAKQKFSEFINNNTPYKTRITFDGSRFQLFIDDVSVLTMNAVGTPSGTVGYQVRNTTGTFQYITAN